MTEQSNAGLPQELEQYKVKASITSPVADRQFTGEFTAKEFLSMLNYSIHTIGGVYIEEICVAEFEFSEDVQAQLMFKPSLSRFRFVLKP
jgi:hypothetical protein